MKKLLCCFLLLFLLTPVALAAPLRVGDNANLLTDAEEQKLLLRADELSEKYGLDIVIATTNDSRGMELGYYAADLVDYNDFRTDNIILVVAMDQRRYVCVTTGYGIHAFTDYALNVIYDEMEDDMVDGHYAQAFDTYLTLCERVLSQAELGAPYDYAVPMETRSFGTVMLTRLGISLAAGFLLAWLIAYTQKRRMKTARAQQSAESYLTHMNLTRSRDIYLYTTTTRRRIESNNGGGGSSTFRGSSGRSHGGGGGGRRF